MKKSHLTIAITPGSEEGVGPELMLKAVSLAKHKESLRFIWCGDEASLMLASDRAGVNVEIGPDYRAHLDGAGEIIFMKDHCGSLPRAAWFLHNAVNLALQKEVDALVTGPLEKREVVGSDGERFLGQTEYFARYLFTEHKAMMCFMGAPFIMSLFSTHVPLCRVPQLVTPEALRTHVRAVAHHVSGIVNKPFKKVHCALLGLNPHAGEDGLIGDEEQKVVTPVIKEFVHDGYHITGPHPADGFFAYFKTKNHLPDVVVAMYHDQGLIPYKLLAEGSAVNVTLGLLIPRVSPAHGTARDLVGGGAASTSSEMAIQIAVQLAQQKS